MKEPSLPLRLQRLRAIFSRGKVAPMAPQNRQQEAAASETSGQPRRRDPAQFVARYLSGKKMQDEAALSHLVIQLAVSLVDPETGIWAQARETLGQLHRMLLFQRGLTGKSENPLWKADPGQSWKEGFWHLLHVQEVFWDHLSIRQRQGFVSAAWDNVLHLAQEWVREGSLVLLYSLLGRAQELLEEEEEEDDMKLNLSALLYKLWKGREVPLEIGALLPQTDDLE